MKIAIAGSGDVGKYFIDELTKSTTHQVVLLTRKRKLFPNAPYLEQRETDYSVDSVSHALQDCDAVISVISAPAEAYIKAHLAILEACIQSPKCKRFIPSEWGINVEDFPDQPIMNWTSRPAVRAALRAQNQIEWTIVCLGWFMDYLLPRSQRYLGDLGVGFPADHTTKTFEMYADGSQIISMTAARDVVRATLALLEQDRGSWKEYTFLAGQSVTFKELYEILRQRDSTWKVERVSFMEALQSIEKASRQGGDASLEYLRIMGFTNCNNTSGPRALVWDQAVLKGVRAYSISEFLDEAEANPSPVL